MVRVRVGIEVACTEPKTDLLVEATITCDFEHLSRAAPLIKSCLRFCCRIATNRTLKLSAHAEHSLVVSEQRKLGEAFNRQHFML